MRRPTEQLRQILYSAPYMRMQTESWYMTRTRSGIRIRKQGRMCAWKKQIWNTIDFRGAEALERGVKHGTVFEQ